MKWIILFCCYLGTAKEQDDKIIISQDEVIAFGKTWEVLPVRGTFLENGSNGVRKANLVLSTIIDGNKVKAYLTVDKEHITFSIPNIENATMTQLPLKNNTIY